MDDTFKNVRGDGKIFVQIASYRDPRLLSTIQDCINQAKFSENLSFGILWHHNSSDHWDNLDYFENDSRFKIIDIQYSESFGVGWARSLLGQLYNNEEYTLELHSHHQFVKNWDSEMISMLEDLKSKGYSRPLLTGPPPALLSSKESSVTDSYPLQIWAKEFTYKGMIVLKTHQMPFWWKMKNPIPARFYTSKFCFTLGQFCREVPHDPGHYFLTNEICHTVRAYTSGYDFFHPHKVFLWHEYSEKDKIRHWHDDTLWCEKNKLSFIRMRKLLGMKTLPEDAVINFGRYGLGEVRSLEEYEKYAGVLFNERAVIFN